MSGYLTEKICPVCGKKYIPAPYHLYKISQGKSGSSVMVCSYACSLGKPKTPKKGTQK